MAQITGFQTIDVVESDGEILISQRDETLDTMNMLYFPPDRADAVIAAIKAVKREIAAKPETPAT